MTDSVAVNDDIATVEEGLTAYWDAPSEYHSALDRLAARLADLHAIALSAHAVIEKAPPDIQKEFLEGIAHAAKEAGS